MSAAMHMLQLNPQIPMVTPKGPAQAIMVMDYSEEHDLLWVCALDEGGAIWAFRNQDVRLFANPSMGRTADRNFPGPPIGPVVIKPAS